MEIPTNIVMGELGSGKTTAILSLVKQIASDEYFVVWVKNEYGDVNVDGMLAREQGIKTEEIMNGCVCCTALGALDDAVEEVLKMNPDRIIIETAGTAHPAPIVMELKRMHEIIIDSIIEVIDALNFKGFSDLGYVRQSHAQYVDFIVLNKIGEVSEQELDKVLDDIYEVYPETPQLRTIDGSISADAVFGVDEPRVLREDTQHTLEHDHEEHKDATAMKAFSWKSDAVCEPEKIEEICKAISTQDVYRIKGIVKTAEGPQMMNSVFSRITWQPLNGDYKQTELLFIGPDANDGLGDRVREQLDAACLNEPNKA